MKETPPAEGALFRDDAHYAVLFTNERVISVDLAGEP
jgi:hypothetical protein